MGEICLGIIARKMRSGHERRVYSDDLLQEACTQLYDLHWVQGHAMPYAYVAARTRLIGYVFVNIRGGGQGHQWALSKQYYIDDNLTEPEYVDQDADGRCLPRLPLALYRRRPVEQAVLAQEAAPAEDVRWQQYERELARILAVMRGQQWHPNSLRRAARALCESVKGTSNYNIARLLEVEWLTATQILIHYRKYIDAFLAQPPLLQGLIRAEGALRLCWWDELGDADLNRGQKLIVILPHGAFTVSYYRKQGRQLGRLQAGRRVGGRLVNRAVQLGAVGGITRQRLWRDSLRLQQKLAALEAAAAGEAADETPL